MSLESQAVILAPERILIITLISLKQDVFNTDTDLDVDMDTDIGKDRDRDRDSDSETNRDIDTEMKWTRHGHVQGHGHRHGQRHRQGLGQRHRSGKGLGPSTRGIGLCSVPQSLSKSKLVHGSIIMTTYYYISEGVVYQGPIR